MGSVHRALGDLAEGMRSLLGVSDARPRLVDELLGVRRRTPPRGRAGTARPSGRGRTGGRHLVRVK